MNKTSIVTELPCGCVERRWCFGKSVIRRCTKHFNERWNLSRAWSYSAAKNQTDSRHD